MFEHYAKLILVPLLAVLTFIMPVWAWLQTAGNPLDYFYHAVPAGQLFYLYSKLMALYAVQLIWLQIMVAMPLLSKTVLVSPSVHAWLGSLAVTAIILHVGLFIAAVFVRSDHFPFALLIPRFSAGYYNAAVSLGLLGLWLIIIVVIAGMLSRKAQSGSTWLHRLSYMAFGFAFIHGLLIGSETRAAGINLLYNGLALSLVIAMLMRFRKSLAYYTKYLRAQLNTLVER